jgi:hypothetical protein
LKKIEAAGFHDPWPWALRLSLRNRQVTLDRGSPLSLDGFEMEKCTKIWMRWKIVQVFLRVKPMTLENPIFFVFFFAWSSFAAFSSYVQAGIDIHTFSLMSLALSENTMDDFRSSPFFLETPIS